jgi:ubiquinone biosynthesis protein COQ4
VKDQARRERPSLADRRRAPIGAVLRTLQAVKHFALLIVAPADRYRNGEMFLRLTEGDSVEREQAEFGRTPAGAALLEERPDVVRLLRDRARLASCPQGSLGRCYSDMLSAGGLDDGVYFDMAVAAAAEYGDPVSVWFRTRVGVMHDLRHLISGYGANRLGEACLLIFRFGQTGHVGQLTLGLLSLLSALPERRSPILPAVLEAYRRGRQSRSVDLIPWEKRLDAPLAAQRAWLGLAPPRRYPRELGVATDAYPAEAAASGRVARTAARGSFIDAALRPLRAAKHLVLLMLTTPPARFRHGGRYATLTEGDSFDRSLAEFAATSVGADLLREQPDLMALLKDQASLEALPEGSVGRQYGELLSTAQLEGDAYYDSVKTAAAEEADAVRAWYRGRIGMMHDLRHLITGYGPDPLGEACLMSFRLAQTRHGGLIALVLFAMAMALRDRPSDLLPAVTEAYRRGRRARSVDLFFWEKGLETPLAGHRAWLRLAPPERYAPGIAPAAYVHAGAAVESPWAGMALGSEVSA